MLCQGNRIVKLCFVIHCLSIKFDTESETLQITLSTYVLKFC